MVRYAGAYKCAHRKQWGPQRIQTENGPKCVLRLLIGERERTLHASGLVILSQFELLPLEGDLDVGAIEELDGALRGEWVMHVNRGTQLCTTNDASACRRTCETSEM